MVTLESFPGDEFLDELNRTYFLSLLRQKRHPLPKARVLIDSAERLVGSAAAALQGAAIAYPIGSGREFSGDASEGPGRQNYSEYAELLQRESQYRAAARAARVWLKKMQAGTGSSMTRPLPDGQVRPGAKGTDLRVEFGGKLRSIAELQVIAALKDARDGVYAQVILHDIVGPETAESVAQIWSSPSYFDPSLTYDAISAAHPSFKRSGKTFQAYVPTLDEKGQLTTQRTAPAGHALFFLDSIRAAYKTELLPKSAPGALIAAISNGEDLSSSPDPVVIGWMVEERLPVVLVTTEKTEIDRKTGLLSLIREPGGEIRMAVIETVQAKEAGQLELFERTQGLCSTNLVLVNYEALIPMLRTLISEMGEDAFLAEIAPDLIQNWKKQRDPDGVERKYLQLEGGMGSSLMNLDRLWRRRRGEPLVRVLNVDRMNRTKFFSPIKSAFDFFLQFHSDRFSLDPETVRLVNHRPGALPEVELADPTTGDRYYQDVANVLASFRGASVLGLNRLRVEGQVRFGGAALRGDVKIVNRSGRLVDLPTIARERGLTTAGEGTILENTEWVISEAGVEIKPWGAEEGRKDRDG